MEPIQQGERPYTSPSRRPLRIFAFDPMLGLTAGNQILVDVRNEELKLGPTGSQVQVIDYDGAARRYYLPVNLDEPAVLLENGLAPSESNPRFHQQMVYAVAMKVIENVERALGRRLRFRSRGGQLHGRGGKLRIFPHAFRGANAYYDETKHALLFGYFRADQADPGANLPGQTVFTCLSHDIIAHETMHAIVDRLRDYFDAPTNRDVYAFHEGIADIVAIFQHFTFEQALNETIQKTRGDLSSPTPLLELAQQFGYATGSGKALRTGLEPGDKPDPTLYQTALEPHDRGSILVRAVFDAFFATYQRRIADLVRIATGGTGRLPDGDLHPDLVNRIAREASKTAQYMLTMCVRAIEYLPPVDVTFGDYLRALITADREFVPADETGQRAATIEAFRRRGIYPDNVFSLAEESLRWPTVAEQGRKIGALPAAPVGDLLSASAREFWHEKASDAVDDESEGRSILDRWSKDLQRFAEQYSAELDLNPDHKIAVDGFHSTYRVSPDGQLHVEVVVQLVQQYTPESPLVRARYGGVRLVGGTTVIATAEGEVRYVVAKRLASPHDIDDGSGMQRLLDFITECDLADPMMTWSEPGYMDGRMGRRLNFAAVHSTIRGRR
jgi:hypothetical protein